MRNYKIIGLTGPSGSGKSIVANALKKHGCGVIDADLLAHKMLLNGSPCINTLCAVFGKDILDDKGNVNRRILAQKAFADKKNTALLNSITHPHIYLLTFERIREYINGGYQTIVFDAPVLFESNGDVICDFTVAVICDRATRKDRIIARDCITIEQADNRFKAQKSDEYYKTRADYVIENNGTVAELESKVPNILAKL